MDPRQLPSPRTYVPAIALAIALGHGLVALAETLVDRLVGPALPTIDFLVADWDIGGLITAIVRIGAYLLILLGGAAIYRRRTRTSASSPEPTSTTV